MPYWMGGWVGRGRGGGWNEVLESRGGWVGGWIVFGLSEVLLLTVMGE